MYVWFSFKAIKLSTKTKLEFIKLNSQLVLGYFPPSRWKDFPLTMSGCLLKRYQKLILWAWHGLIRELTNRKLLHDDAVELRDMPNWSVAGVAPKQTPLVRVICRRLKNSTTWGLLTARGPGGHRRGSCFTLDFFLFFFFSSCRYIRVQALRGQHSRLFGSGLVWFLSSKCY